MKNNHSDFATNIWIALFFITPIVQTICNISVNKELPDLDSLIYLTYFILKTFAFTLPFNFIFIKISKAVYQFNIPNWQIKLILMIAVFFIIIFCQILFFHKTTQQIAYYESRYYELLGSYFSRYIIITFHFTKFYLIIAVLSIWYFKVIRPNYQPKKKTYSDIIDEDLDF